MGRGGTLPRSYTESESTPRRVPRSWFLALCSVPHRTSTGQSKGGCLCQTWYLSPVNLRNPGFLVPLRKFPLPSMESWHSHPLQGLREAPGLAQWALPPTHGIWHRGANIGWTCPTRRCRCPPTQPELKFYSLSKSQEGPPQIKSNGES